MARALRSSAVENEAVPVRATPRRKQPINDLDLKNWKTHDDIWVDSLWMIPDRDSSGAHSGHYHGNFVPQIPRQMMQRYTRQGDAVLDCFAGSGTTLIEAARSGRHGFGIELLPAMAKEAEERARSECSTEGLVQTVVRGDSRSQRAAMQLRTRLAEIGKDRVQLIVAHPPYHDIIRFSENDDCLSNAGGVDQFCEMYGQVVDNLFDLLEDGRYFCLVIGDKYTGGEWVPLGFMLMQEMMRRSFKLKSLIVKNMAGNRAKRNLEQLWRFRALSGGFYIFKHEYVMVFQKPVTPKRRGKLRALPT